MRADLSEISGVKNIDHLHALVRPQAGGGQEVWVRLASLEALESAPTISERSQRAVGSELASSSLYGELRHVDGALLAWA